MGSLGGSRAYGAGSINQKSLVFLLAGFAVGFFNVFGHGKARFSKLYYMRHVVVLGYVDPCAKHERERAPY